MGAPIDREWLTLVGGWALALLTLLGNAIRFFWVGRRRAEVDISQIQAATRKQLAEAERAIGEAEAAEPAAAIDALTTSLSAVLRVSEYTAAHSDRLAGQVQQLRETIEVWEERYRAAERRARRLVRIAQDRTPDLAPCAERILFGEEDGA